MRAVIELLLPQGTLRRRLARRLLVLLRTVGIAEPYHRWRLEQVDKLPLLPLRDHARTPLISVVVPVFNTPQHHLRAMVYSVVAQTYPHWELVLVDASSDPEARAHVRSAALSDTRIRVLEVDNTGIAGNTNAGIAAAEGDFVAFCDHDDTLSADALDEVVAAINANPDAGLLYSDEDKVSDDGTRYSSPFMKPSWSPHLLVHVNYLNHLTVIRRDLLEQVGALDPALDGAQDFDLVLRVIDAGAEVVHVPRVLYHWRTAAGSTATDIGTKPQVLAAGVQAVQRHLDRRGIPGRAEAMKDRPGFYVTTFDDPRDTITVAIPPFANPRIIQMFVQLLAEQDLLDGYRVLLPAASRYVPDAQVIDVGAGDAGEVGTGGLPSAEAHTAFLREACARTDGPLVVLDELAVPEDGDWAVQLAGLLHDDRVHAVAPAMVDGTDTVLDMGLIRMGPELRMLLYAHPFGHSTFMGTTAWPRDVDQLTGAVTAVRAPELRAHLADGPAPAPGQTAVGGFTAHAGDRFDVVWSLVKLIHVRAPMARDTRATRFGNPNLMHDFSNVWGYADLQQTTDALAYHLSYQQRKREKAQKAGVKSGERPGTGSDATAAEITASTRSTG